MEDRTLLSTAIPLNPSSWTPIGPAPVFFGEAYSGRINGIAADPTSAGTIYIAADGGGVWKTADGGSSWIALTDDQISLKMASIVLAPGNPQVVYAGTSGANPHGGVLKSTDAGAHWSLLSNNGNFDQQTITKIVIDPSNINTVYAAVGGNTRAGVWRSTDGGATWSNTTAGITTAANFSDLVMDPSNPQSLYAGVSAHGIYKTSDGGTSWALLGSAPTGQVDANISLAISRTTSPVTLYAAIVGSGQPGSAAYGDLFKMLKSTNGGASWTDLTASTPHYFGDTAGYQGNYDSTLAVDPTNANVVFAGGAVGYATNSPAIIESRDGGASWAPIAHGTTAIVPHTDHQAFAFDANGKYLDGNDGGIYRLDSPDPANLSWSDLNGNLQITELRSIAINPANENIAYAGSQDNGVDAFGGTLSWSLPFGGDGAAVLFDPQTPSTIYAEVIGLGLFRSDDGGKTFATTPKFASSAFPLPIAIDPLNHNNLCIGTDHIYTTGDRGNTWNAIASPNQAGWNTSSSVTSIAMANVHSTIYATTADGKVFATTTAVNWVERDVPGAFIDGIAVDPSNGQILYTYGTVAGVASVFRSTNAGVAWQNITGTLPNLRVNTILPDVQSGSTRLYVGNGNGVYLSSDLGATWTRYGAGLPNVEVTSLDLSHNLGVLAAGTYGRGAWEMQLPLVVTNTNDSGPGSLRQAILDANAHPGRDLIAFGIPGAGVHTIAPLSPLPPIADSAIIDGRTQPGYAGKPLIELNGSGAGSATDGLVIAADNSAVYGLDINRFGHQGVVLQAKGALVASCYIGTDPTGTTALGNGVQGILITGANNTVGGSVAGAGNVISGNLNDGLQIAGAGAQGNVVEGNKIGTDAGGTLPVPNRRLGILINFSARSNVIGTNGDGMNDGVERNVISGNAAYGVQIGGQGTQQNVVAGNFIGTDVNGTSAVPNGAGGVLINAMAQSNLIGTDGVSPFNAHQGNVISGNTNSGSPGIYIGDASTNGNVVAGNFIGTDVTGNLPLGNGGVGVFVADGPRANLIGTNGDGRGDASERNIISANAYQGVALGGPGTSLNQVQGNAIGTQANGSSPLGNGLNGVYLYGGAQSNSVGGSALLGNVIAYNGQNGAAVVDPTTTGNAIRANRFFGNALLAIDLAFDGVSPNDKGDLDGGPDGLQNYPLITSATPGSNTTVAGTLDSLANTIFTIDFYAGTTPDPSYFGAAQRYLGSTTVTTNSSGIGNFSVTLPAASTAGDWVSATATGPTGDTSEFSAAEPLPWQGIARSSTSWVAIGPGPIAAFPAFSGRIGVAAADPSNPNVMYVGGDQGGIWKTTDWLDPSPVWNPLTDGQTSETIGGGANGGYQTLAVYRGNSKIIYAAAAGPGGSILKSTDGGATWTALATALFDKAAFGSIALSPTDPSTLYVTVRGGGIPGGVYKSTDGGSTWVNKTSFHPGAATDIVMDPANPAILYVGLVMPGGGSTSGVYKSTDAGNTWTRLATGLLSGSAIGGGIKLAIAQSNSQVLYANVFDPALGNGADGMPHRFVTVNGGTSWSALAALPGPDESRSWHAVLAVDPTRPSTVYTNGDHAIYQSNDSGAHWSGISLDDPTAASFDDSGAVVLVGDRGIYRSASGSAPFVNKQGNLQTAQFYTLTLDPANPDVAYGISQDQLHALKFTGGLAWSYLGNGTEVGKILVDPTRPGRLYDFDPLAGSSDSPNPAAGFVLRSDDGGATWANKGSGIDTSVAGFNYAYTSQNAFVIDPGNPNRLLVGTRHVYESANDADTWKDISPAGFAGSPFVTALGVAPSQGNTVYAATGDGHLYVTVNDGATWSQRDSGLPIDAFDHIGSIQIDPLNPNRAFIASTNFPNNLFGSARVWMTTNGGVSWTDIKGNLPPSDWTTSLAVDWRPPTPLLYVGTARGVFNSANLGSTWTPYKPGLPSAVVTDVEFLPQYNLLAAATYGRGVFEILTSPAEQISLSSSASTSTYGQSLTFSVTIAPVGSGLPTPTGTVQFQVDGSNFGSSVALVNGAATSPALAGLSAGSHSVTALYSGDPTYAAASANLSQTVNKAHLTVAADAKSKLYGNPLPSLTATLSGFVNGDTASVVSGAAALGTVATPSSPVGSYTITVGSGTLTASNYDFPNLVSGSLTVTRAHLTVTADAKSKLYGDPLPSLTATLSGFVNGDAAGVVSGAAALGTSATASSPVGSYAITVVAGTLAAANYDFPNLVAGTLTVTKAHLTVTADGKSKTYGDPLPSLTATLSGFVNGDAAGVVSGTAALITTATASSPVGSYPITVGAGTLSAANYDFPNLVAGTLTIARAHLTVTADDKTRFQGAANPALTYTITGFLNGDSVAVVTGAAALNTPATTGSPVGSYPITVGAGTLSAANYDFPNLVSGTLTVNSPGGTVVSVVASATAPTYGQALTFTATVAQGSGGAPVPTGTIQFQVDGVVLGAAIALSGGSAISPAIASLGAGSHTVSAVYSGDASYTGNAGSVGLSVGKAHLTVVADAKSKLYGDPLPALTATLGGFVNGDTASVVSGAAALGTPATASSPVGSYAITVGPGTLAAANYDFTNIVAGTLVVARAHLTVTADDKSKTYGDALPSLTATLSGFVNGDTASVVSGAAALGTSATASSAVGAYAITAGPGTLMASNYDFPTLVPATLTIGKAHLTVTADGKSKTYGDPLPALTATLSGFVNGDAAGVVSGTAALSTTATASSPVGSYPITAGAGTLAAANYDFPNLVAGSLAVTKANLTVTADSKSKTYGNPLPSLTATLSGFVNGDTASLVSGAATLSTSATASSPVNSYAIIVDAGTLAAANYDFTNFVAGTLTVGKAHLTVTADSKSKTYGDPLPALTATLSGFVNGDSAAVLGGVAALGTEATASSPVGSYAITVGPGTLTAANYDFPNLVSGTLTVNKAHLTVTADGKSKSYGDPVPALTYTISGLVNGDTTSVVVGTAALGTAATGASPAGAYVITIAQNSLAAANYDFPNLVAGSLTVTKAHLTVTADGKSKTYGDPLPALTATLSGFVNGDAAGVVSGAAALGTSATSASGVGAYPITVGAGTLSAANYDFPNLVAGSLTVTKAHLTVTADGKSKAYGDALPPLTVTLGGLVNGDSAAVVSGVPALGTSATASSPVGLYPITAGLGTLSTANYDFTSFVDGTLVVTKAHLTVTADSKAKTYGDPVPALTSTISGLVNGDTLGVIQGLPDLGTTATVASVVGFYPITIAQGTLSAVNYDFPNLVPGSITVSRAHLTVTADSRSKTYGDPVPQLTATITGFAHGENLATSGVIGSPMLATTATQGTHIGGRSITVDQGTLAAINYDFTTFNPGTLTITPAPLTVTADARSRGYGEPNPTLTASYSGFVAGDTASVLGGSPTLTTPANPASPVSGGPYPITVGAGTLQSADYLFRFVDSVLTVTKALLTVTADNKTRRSGSPNPTFTASYSGFKNFETLATSGVTGSPALNTSATTSSPPGAYPIVVARGTLAAGNYDFRLVNGTLTVTSTNRPPTATVRLNTSTPLTNSVLTATAKKADPDHDPVRLTFVWRVNGVVVRTFTSSKALSDRLNLAPLKVKKGASIVVSVRPNDGVRNGATVSAKAVATTGSGQSVRSTGRLHAMGSNDSVRSSPLSQGVGASPNGIDRALADLASAPPDERIPEALVSDWARLNKRKPSRMDLTA